VIELFFYQLYAHAHDRKKPTCACGFYTFYKEISPLRMVTNYLVREDVGHCFKGVLPFWRPKNVQMTSLLKTWLTVTEFHWGENIVLG